MKHFCYEMPPDVYQKASRPIRTKQDILELLIHAIKIIVSCPFQEERRIDSSKKLVLHVDKMSRLLFMIEDKIFTFHFPFVVQKIEDSNMLLIKYQELEIDSMVSSVVFSIVCDIDLFDASLQNMEDFILQYVFENEWEDIDPNDLCKLIKHLTLFEPGYLRYDHDLEHANGTLHPEHHLDMFYSSNNEVKVGLESQINSEWLIDFMDIRTNCKFIK